MDTDERQELDRLILEEKRLVARDILASAWEDGIEAGIEPDLLAESLIHAAIEELVRRCGAPESEKLVQRLVQMEDEGRFTTARTLQ